MSRVSLVAIALLAVLSGCIRHPPETTTVRRPEGPVALGTETDTAVTYLVVDRHWADDAVFFDKVEADTTSCGRAREVCTDLYSGKIEETVLIIVPEGEEVRGTEYGAVEPTAPAAPLEYRPNWTRMETQVDRLRDRAFQARLNENWGLANELDSQAFWLQYEIDRLRWWGRYGWNGQH